MTTFKTTLQELDKTLKHFPLSAENVNKLLELEEAVAIADAACELKLADDEYQYLINNQDGTTLKVIQLGDSRIDLQVKRQNLSNLVIERLEKLLVD